MEFNSFQIQAINHKDGPCLVSAHPGSGKTSVLTERVSKLIASGIPQNNLICITFTNKAAGEMKERICKKLGVEKINFYVGTFHSLCSTILRKYSNKVGYKYNFNILDDSDQESLIKKIARSLGKDIKKDEINVNFILKTINDGREKNTLDTEIDEQFEDNQTYKEIARIYLKTIKEENVIDFSGLLYEVYNLLTNNKDVLETIQENCKYILVDEVQDTNFIQFKIIELLGGKYRNIFAVGDLNQSIFAFRGARYQNIIDFLNNYKNCVKIELPENYRSTPEIVKIASKLISHNKSNISGPMMTSNPSGPPVVCKGFYDATEEAYWVSNKIKYFIEELGYDYSDVFILYRINSLSLEIQMALTKNNIPFTVVGGNSFFDKMEIKDTISLLKLCNNFSCSSSFERVMKLLDGVGDRTIGQIENIAKERKVDLLTTCKEIEQFTEKAVVKKAAKKLTEIFNFDYSDMNIGDLLSILIEKFEYKKYLENIKNIKDSYQERIENIDELILNCTQFSKEGGTLEKYLQNISLLSSVDKSEDGKKSNKVMLSTIHGSKGLENHCVLGVGLDLVPHPRAINEDPKNLEEERRLFYVLLSRSKKNLLLSFCNNRKTRDNRGNIIYRKAGPTQFLKEIDLVK